MRKRDIARLPKGPIHNCYHAEHYGVHLLAHFNPNPNLAPRDTWRLCPACLEFVKEYLKELCLDETE